MALFELFQVSKWEIEIIKSLIFKLTYNIWSLKLHSKQNIGVSFFTGYLRKWQVRIVCLKDLNPFRILSGVVMRHFFNLDKYIPRFLNKNWSSCINSLDADGFKMAHNAHDQDLHLEVCERICYFCLDLLYLLKKKKSKPIYNAFKYKIR